MDLYYFYNGMNNIVKLSTNHKYYLDNYKKIHNPIILLYLETHFNLKGGAGAGAGVAAAVLKGAVSKGASGAGGRKKKLAKTKEEILKIEAEERYLKQEEKEIAAELESKELSEETEAQKKRDQKESLTTRGLDALKLLIKIVVFLTFITLLPIAPFIAISYYSFKKLKEYYDNQIVTL